MGEKETAFNPEDQTQRSAHQAAEAIRRELLARQRKKLGGPPAEDAGQTKPEANRKPTDGSRKNPDSVLYDLDTLDEKEPKGPEDNE